MLNPSPRVYKTQVGTGPLPSKWSAWQDSNLRSRAPEARAFARLSYTQMALLKGLEPSSADRQSARLTRCVQEQVGVLGEIRTRTVQLLKLTPPAIGLRAQNGAPRGNRTRPMRGLRDRRPHQSGYRCIGEPRWLRSTWRWVKRPVPLHSGLASGSVLVRNRRIELR